MDNDREADKIYAAGSQKRIIKSGGIYSRRAEAFAEQFAHSSGGYTHRQMAGLEYRRQGDGRADEIFAETVRLAKLQISYGRNLRDVNDAKYCLAEVYSMYGMHDKALDIADTLPPEYTSVSGVLKANIKRGAGDIASEIEQREDNIVGFLLAINNEIYGLGEGYAKLGRYDEAVRTYASFLKALEIFSSLKDKLKARRFLKSKSLNATNRWAISIRLRNGAKNHAWISRVC
jgi:tetratricopeptide (TPR) repeat protein